jgi:hypothetical protein
MSGIVAYLWVGVEQFVCEIAEGIIVEGKLPLESPIRHPATPHHLVRLYQDILWLRAAIL